MTERLYYVEKRDETFQTSNRFEASKIAAEWVRRGYEVDVAVVEVSDQAVVVSDTREAA